MPPTEKHLATSMKRTGKDFAELHHWIDDSLHKNERHDFTRIWDFGPGIFERFGEEGVREYIEHLREDMEKKLNKTRQDNQEVFDDACAYFGIKRREGKTMSKEYSIRQADIDLLRQAGVTEPDIAHCLAVAAKALEIAKRVHTAVDMEVIGRGALFHDLGKAKTHAIEHGRIGAEMGEVLGLPAAITAIMEKHIRGGLTAGEATELGLPVKDYSLTRLEERIVIYADRLVDIITDGLVSLQDQREAETRFEEILTDIPKYGKNEATLNRYIGYHREIQTLIGR